MRVYARRPGSSEYVGPLEEEEFRELVQRRELPANVEVLVARGQSKYELEHSTEWREPAASLMGWALADGGQPSASAGDEVHPQSESLPGLTVLFRIIAALEMIGGVMFCAQLWPGDPEPGYTWKTAAYVPALTWLIAGFVFGLMFWALGDGLLYLRDIRSILAESRATSAGAPQS